MPVPLDVDVIGEMDAGRVVWNARYDPGRPYLFHGLWQLDIEAIHRGLRLIASERDFLPEVNARAFYGMAGAGFVRAVV